LHASYLCDTAICFESPASHMWHTYDIVDYPYICTSWLSNYQLLLIIHIHIISCYQLLLITYICVLYLYKYYIYIYIRKICDMLCKTVARKADMSHSRDFSNLTERSERVKLIIAINIIICLGVHQSISVVYLDQSGRFDKSPFTECRKI